MRRNFLFALVLFLAAGCASVPKENLSSVAKTFPAESFMTHRGVLTALGRQFTLNGYLARSKKNGLRLIITENFGNVFADVLVKPDGAVHIMRSSKALKEKWIARYVAADLKCIFGNSPMENCPGTMLSPTHFVIDRRWYKLDLKIVETKPGPQSPELFDESRKATP